jgi:hypothetical protein
VATYIKNFEDVRFLVVRPYRISGRHINGLSRVNMHGYKLSSRPRTSEQSLVSLYRVYSVSNEIYLGARGSVVG